MANIVYNGVNKNTLNLTGNTVAQAVAKCADLLNLDEDSILKVNGSEVNADYVIEDGDILEFVKEAGVKGAAGDSVVVQSGINRVTIQIGDDDTVADILRKASLLIGVGDISAESAVNVNGEPAAGNSKIVGGDNIEVVKEAGSKGR